MKQFLITVAGVLVGLILFAVIGPILLFSTIANNVAKSAPKPAAVVLSLDLREEFPDQPTRAAFGPASDARSTVELVRNLEAAATDKHVKGILIRANTFGMAPAQAEEVRTAIAAFRASGKFVLTHWQSDAFETAISGYAAIAGSDEIWLQETGEIGAMGIGVDQPFLGGFFAKFKLRPEFVQREEYKNAVNSFTERGFTAPHREAEQQLIGGLYETFLSHIAADRKQPVEAIRAAIEATPASAQQALAAKLVDKLGRPEDLVAAAMERAGDEAELMAFADYEAPRRDGPVIALVTAEGSILSGPPTEDFFGGEVQINSDETAQALLDAADDADVQAIVFRVSSPGGSPVASDQILNAVKLAQSRGKKVVVSMGDYAASGGYYISASADEIVALPTTITGSIGIFAGKVAAGEALEEYLGVTSDQLKVGSANMNMTSFARPFTNEQKQVFTDMIDRGYLDFKTKVSEGRKMPMEKVAALAKGRVWTGAEAKANGLVDTLGGLSVAVERAKALAGIKADKAVKLKLFPAQRSPVEELQALFGVSAEGARAAATLGGVLGDARVAAAIRETIEAREPRMRAEEAVRVR